MMWPGPKDLGPSTLIDCITVSLLCTPSVSIKFSVSLACEDKLVASS